MKKREELQGELDRLNQKRADDDARRVDLMRDPSKTNALASARTAAAMDDIAAADLERAIVDAKEREEAAGAQRERLRIGALVKTACEAADQRFAKVVEINDAFRVVNRLVDELRELDQVVASSAAPIMHSLSLTREESIIAYHGGNGSFSGTALANCMPVSSMQTLFGRTVELIKNWPAAEFGLPGHGSYQSARDDRLSMEAEGHATMVKSIVMRATAGDPGDVKQ